MTFMRECSRRRGVAFRREDSNKVIRALYLDRTVGWSVFKNDRHDLQDGITVQGLIKRYRATTPLNKRRCLNQWTQDM